MAIPLKYNLRNLFVRKVSTAMTVFVVCLVVTVFLFVLALWQGVSRTLSITASTRNVITMRVGSQAEMQSVITKDANEAVVSKNLANRFAGMKIGDTIKTGSYRWVVVGHFDASGSAYESEIWTDVKDLQGQTKRQIFSSIFVRTSDP